MIDRKITKTTYPGTHQGFLGQGHAAVSVIDGSDMQRSDPFTLLMDDQLDLPGNDVVGGAHPHAGFEISTLVLEGQTGDGDRSSSTGDMEWLTAGSGIVHTEEIKSQVKLRILQLWLRLPENRTGMAPRWQKIPADKVPLKKINNSDIRIYSGSAFGLTSPVMNEVPTTILFIRLAPGDELTVVLPASYNGLIYIIDGTIKAGGNETLLEKQQVGWLDRPMETGDSNLKLKGGSSGAQFFLYAAQPQETQIYSKGPFISDKRENFPHLYHRYNSGQMPHLNDLPEDQLFYH
ncbi:pirin family protein [Mucilaginibacter sp. JRF]|uniref:pirin family protein n=1 Tax=Mucilaginibacter sp. JRF TaxID=2780088 RepID=UPI00188072B4|nr:pirin-like C-terminal cupin domain-containing protein [Mucilaginibacter sp. JRF]MBE9583275.1 pirin family protein [Mucilaginibacter sp. JRF]